MGSKQSVPTLYVDICPESQVVQRYLNHGQFHPGDSGLDLYILYDFKLEGQESCLVDLGIRCQAYTLKNDVFSRLVRVFKKNIPESHKRYSGYWLCPRSSISKTPMMMSNSIGLIDASYTGNLKVPLRNVTMTPCQVRAGERLVQIVGPQQNPIVYSLVSELRTTSRGAGGFGSTNNKQVSTIPGGSLTPKFTVVQPSPPRRSVSAPRLGMDLPRV